MSVSVPDPTVTRQFAPLARRVTTASVFSSACTRPPLDPTTTCSTRVTSCKFPAATSTTFLPARYFGTPSSSRAIRGPSPRAPSPVRGRGGIVDDVSEGTVAPSLPTLGGALSVRASTSPTHSLNRSSAPGPISTARKPISLSIPAARSSRFNPARSNDSAPVTSQPLPVHQTIAGTFGTRGCISRDARHRARTARQIPSTLPPLPPPHQGRLQPPPLPALPRRARSVRAREPAGPVCL